MEKIELLEKLVKMQEMHIELMNDYNNLQCSYKSLKEVKNGRIKDLLNKIEGQSEEIGALEVKNRELIKQIAELKHQYEELQQSIISIETPEENQ